KLKAWPTWPGAKVAPPCSVPFRADRVESRALPSPLYQSARETAVVEPAALTVVPEPSGTVARAVAPSRKVTVPAGVGWPAAAGVTVARKVTGWPATEGLGLAASVVTGRRSGTGDVGKTPAVSGGLETPASWTTTRKPKMPIRP